MVKILILLLIGTVTVLSVNKLLQAISEQKIRNILKEELSYDETPHIQSGIKLALSPTALSTEMKKVSEVPYTKRNYISRFLLGLVIGFGITYVLYRTIIISIVGAMVLAFMFPYFDLVKKQKEYRDEIKAKLIHYFKLFSSYMRSTNYNIVRSLEYCVEGIESPIKGDVEKIVFDLKQGMNPEKAFSYFNEKYPYQGVELFHHLALLIAEQGRDEHESLKEASNRFAEKRYWQNKLDQNNKKLIRDRKGILVFSLFIYLMMMLMTSKYYEMFITSFVGVITITLSLLYYGLTIYSQKGLLELDPTEVSK